MRIGSSLSGIDLTAQNNLLRAFNELNQSNTRLATMKRVNSGRDDPAGLIAIGQMQSELTAIREASDNASRAVGLIRTADSGLGQVSSLLNDVRGAIVSVAGGGLSKAEIAAKQLEVDAAMEAINRIGNTTSFGGRNLLDGQGGYRVSDVNAEQVTDIQVQANAGGGQQTPDIEVTQAATAAEMTFNNGSGSLDQDTTLMLSGDQGTVTLQFSAGTTLDQVATAVQASQETSGVTASVDGNDLTLTSTAVGSDATVSAAAIEGTFDVGPDTTVEGTDIVVNVDGVEFTGDGNQVQVDTATLKADIEFAEGFTGEVDPITISGDAMTFSFSPKVSQTASVAMPTINTAALGNGNGRLSDLTSGGKFDLSSGNLSQAMEVIDAASMDVLRGRAQAGAFEKYTIESSQEMLGAMEVNISSALSTILDTDVATETSRLVRSQILVDASVSTLKIAGRSRSLISGLFDSM
ncbi:MAG TPA: flagellin [Thermoguttaceae bacterium]|nr:flagellin [Thermoguttaceae bacterium]